MVDTNTLSDNISHSVSPQHRELSDGEREALFVRIEGIIAEVGIKSCTMDRVAASLGMSKRTLYEIFDSKDEMIVAVLTRMHERQQAEAMKIFDSAPNVMEAMARHTFTAQRHMQSFSARFFRDLHRYPLLHDYMQKKHTDMMEHISKVMRQGVEQGVFRANVDYDVTIRLMHLQHESLACMHDHFPPEVTIAQAFEAISIGFLRSIATPDGMKILDGITDSLRTSKIANNNH